VSTGSLWLRLGTSKRGNEILGFTKCWEFLSGWATLSFSSMNQHYGVIQIYFLLVFNVGIFRNPGGEGRHVSGSVAMTHIWKRQMLMACTQDILGSNLARFAVSHSDSAWSATSGWRPLPSTSFAIYYSVIMAWFEVVQCVTDNHSMTKVNN
jgi:hypothetical protein